MRVASGAMAALFAFSAAVQYNDPDPLRWMAIYGAAMLVSVVGAAGRVYRAGSLALGAVALGWAAWTAFEVRGPVPLGDVFGRAQMKTEGVELVREALGLGIVAAWMGALAWGGRQKGGGS